MTQKTQPSALNQLSITVLAAALIIFFGWQYSQISQLKSNLVEANEQRAVQFEQSNLVQTKTSEQLESFLSDLLALAETDPQAAALVERYNIRRNAPAPEETADSADSDN
jgi:hypothetical protein